MKKYQGLRVITTALCLFAWSFSFAQGTFTSIANGNWSSLSTWSSVGADYNSNGYPDGLDNVVINTNVVSDVAPLTVNSLVIQSSTLTIGAGNLTVNSLYLTGGSAIDATDFVFSIVVGSLVVYSGSPGAKSIIGVTNCPALTVNGATDIYGHLSWAALPITGTQTFNAVNVYVNGTFDNTSGVSINLNGSITNNGAWLSPASNTGGVYHITSAGSYTYSGTTSINMVELSIDAASTITNLGTLALSNSGGVGLNVATGGKFINGAGGYLSLSSPGSAISNTGTLDFTTSTNEVDYSYSGNQNVYTTTYSKLTISGSGTKSLTGATTVNNTLTTSSTVILDDGGFSLTGASGANIVMTGTSQIRFRYAATQPQFTGTSNTFASGTTIELAGTAAQTLKTSSTFPYQNVLIDGASGCNVNLSNVTNIGGNLTVGGSALFNNNAVLTVLGTTTYSSSNVTTATTLTNNLTTGSFIVTNGKFTYSNKTITINGTNGQWSQTGGTVTSLSATVQFITGSGQTIGGSSAAFTNLTINNSNDVTLSNNVTVSASLTLTTGRVITGSNTLIINSPGTVSRTNGFVEGYLQKPATVSPLTFEVGTGTVYSPLKLSLSTLASTITVSATATNDPNISSSIIDPSKSVNRYWTLTTGATNPIVKPTFTFASSDYGSANYLNFNYSYLNQSTFVWTNVVPSSTPTATGLDDSSSAGFNLTSNNTIRLQIGEVLFSPTNVYYTRLRGALNWSAASTWIQYRTGTIAYTSGSTAVTGTSTKFLSELAVNDYIMDQTVPGTVIGQVQSIADDTHLTLVANASATASSISYGRQKVPGSSYTDIVHLGNGNVTSPASSTTVTLDQDATVYSLDFYRNTQGVVLQHSSGKKMTVYSTVSVGVSTSGTAGKITSWNINDGTATVGGTLTLASGTLGTSHYAKVVLTTGSLTVKGNLTFSMTSGSTSDQSQVLDLGTSGLLNLGGSITFGTSQLASLLSGTSSTINFNGSVAQSLYYPIGNTTVNSWAYPNIVSNNSSTSGLTLTQSWAAPNGTSKWTFNGGLRVQSGILNLSGYNITGQTGQTLKVDPGATLKITGASSFPSGFSSYDLGISSPFGTVYYNVSSSFALPSGVIFGTLTQSSSVDCNLAAGSNVVAGNLTSNGTGGFLTPSASTLAVGGDVSIGSNSYFDAASLSAFTVGSSWYNNGSYFTNTETLTFTGTTYSGSASTQPISIAGSAQEIFNNLTINTLNSTDIVQLQKDIEVTNVLSLSNGGLDLDGYNVTIGNNSPGAISQTGSAYIKSETTSYPYSTIKWTLGGTTGNYVFPFGKSATEYIPFTFQVTSPSSSNGILSVATYHTSSDNKPYPQGVTDMNSNGVDISTTNVVDRFWIITPSSFTTYPTATVTFTATPAEVGTLTNLKAQRWNQGNTWDKPLSQTSSVYGSSVPNLSIFSPWTLSGSNLALPIELTGFKAEFLNTKTVQLYWETKSEIDNNYFVIERSSNGNDFFEILRVSGNGTTNESHVYFTNDERPLHGLSFYRLKQVDFDGQIKTVGNVVSIFVDTKDAVAFPNPIHRGDKLTIQLPSSSPYYLISLIDSFGQEIINEVKSTPWDSSAIDFKVLENLSEGIYFVLIKSEGGVFKTKISVLK